MTTSIKTTIKAQAIAAAIYSITNIQPDIIQRPNLPPIITFSPENSKKIQAFIDAQMKKKSDVDIDFYPYVAPVVLKTLLPAAASIMAAVFFIGYYIGQR